MEAFLVIQKQITLEFVNNYHMDIPVRIPIGIAADFEHEEANNYQTFLQHPKNDNLS